MGIFPILTRPWPVIPPRPRCSDGPTNWSPRLIRPGRLSTIPAGRMCARTWSTGTSGSAGLAAWRTALSGLASGFAIDLGSGGVQHKQLMADGSAPANRVIMNSEYGTGRTSVERAWVMRWQTQELRRFDEANGYVYCELYDIEHETAGVLTYDRRPKETAGQQPADVHAETVIVVDLIPVEPGVDLIVGDARFSFSARVSSHASGLREVRLQAAWGAVASTEAAAGAAVMTIGALQVLPYVLSQAVTVGGELPRDEVGARLHLWAETVGADGRRIAHTVVDVWRATQLPRPVEFTPSSQVG